MFDAFGPNKLNVSTLDGQIRTNLKKVRSMLRILVGIIFGLLVCSPFAFSQKQTKRIIVQGTLKRIYPASNELLFWFRGDSWLQKNYCDGFKKFKASAKIIHQLQNQENTLFNFELNSTSCLNTPTIIRIWTNQ